MLLVPAENTYKEKELTLNICTPTGGGKQNVALYFLYFVASGTRLQHQTINDRLSIAWTRLLPFVKIVNSLDVSKQNVFLSFQ